MPSEAEEVGSSFRDDLAAPFPLRPLPETRSSSSRLPPGGRDIPPATRRRERPARGRSKSPAGTRIRRGAARASRRPPPRRDRSSTTGSRRLCSPRRQAVRSPRSSPFSRSRLGNFVQPPRRGRGFEPRRHRAEPPGLLRSPRKEPRRDESQGDNGDPAEEQGAYPAGRRKGNRRRRGARLDRQPGSFRRPERRVVRAQTRRGLGVAQDRPQVEGEVSGGLQPLLGILLEAAPEEAAQSGGDLFPDSETSGGSSFRIAVRVSGAVGREKARRPVSIS